MSTPALDPALLAIIVCPSCRSSLSLDEVAGEPGTVELVCQGCGLAYPVRDEIPVLLVDEGPPARLSGDN